MIEYKPYKQFIVMQEYTEESDVVSLDIAYSPTLPGDIALGEVYKELHKSSRTPLNWIAA